MHRPTERRSRISSLTTCDSSTSGSSTELSRNCPKTRSTGCEHESLPLRPASARPRREGGRRRSAHGRRRGRDRARRRAALWLPAGTDAGRRRCAAVAGRATAGRVRTRRADFPATGRGVDGRRDGVARRLSFFARLNQHWRESGAVCWLEFSSRSSFVRYSFSVRGFC